MIRLYSAVFGQVLKLFVFLLLGFVLTRKKILPEQTPLAFSKFLIWMCIPALSFKTFSANFTLDILRSSGALFMLTAAMLAASYLVGMLTGRFFSKDGYVRNVITYSVTVPNTGYFGNVLIIAVLGDLWQMKFQFFNFLLIIFSYTEGYRLMLGRRISLKSFINPMVIAMLAGMAFGLLNIKVPDAAYDILTSLVGCLGPVSMVSAGCVIAQYSLKKILTEKLVYITVFVRMIVMPLIAVGLRALGFIPAELAMLLVMQQCLPTGLNSIVFPSSIGKDSSLGAGMVCVSSLLAVVTVPLFFSLVL